MKIALRDLERESIRDFVQRAADEGYLSGRVLDYGCGKQPYRPIVEAAGGEYVGYDRADNPANVGGVDHGPDDWSTQDWGAILCTQVVQYIPLYPYYDGLQAILADMSGCLYPHGGNPDFGCLVLTYPTNWPEVEPEDLHRFTKAGMERLLTEAGFKIVLHELRAVVECHHNYWPIGYGVICRA